MSSSPTPAGVPDVLRKIIEVKKDEVAALKRGDAMARLRDECQSGAPVRRFTAALRARAGRSDVSAALIAEVKKASPSKGVIREDFRPGWIAERYEAGGAACLSVLTDVHFFQGALAYLREARGAVSLPALRKDFTIDRIQLFEARAAGADAVLLIAACLDPNHLADLHAEATEALGMDVLVEVHDQAEWEAVAGTGVRFPLVGINNRNLHDFTLTLDTTDELAPGIAASGALVVAESGIFTPADVARVRRAGATAILVGESLMRQPDPGEAARQLLEPATR